MIRTRAERELFRNYCSSSTIPPRHVLIQAWMGGGFELGWPSLTLGPILFRNYCVSGVNMKVVFFVTDGLGGLMAGRCASDW